MDETPIINYGNIDNSNSNDKRGRKIYCHIAPNGKIYIGQTLHPLNQRSGRNGTGYKTCACFWNAIQKYGWENFEHVVLVDGLSKEMADIVEIELIKKYQTQNIEFGYNLSNGGYLPANTKKAYQYDMNGCFVKEYESLAEAAYNFNVSRLRPYVYLYEDIFHSCGYLWTLNNYGKNIDKDILDIILWRISTHGGQNKCVPVYQYDLEYNLLAKHKSTKDAMLNTGMNQYSLKGACYKNREFNGYIWSFKDNLSKNNKKKNNGVKEDMIQIKDSDARTIAKKRTIKFTGVYIEDGKLVDENGSIAEQLEPELPKWIDTIDFKITFDLPDDDMDIDAPDESDFDNDNEVPSGYEGLTF